MCRASALLFNGPSPAPSEPTGCQAVPSNQATLSARASPFAFWNDPPTNKFEPLPVRVSISAEVGNQPFVPAVFEPSALHADPSHLATWSAFGSPAMSFASEPT